MLTKQKTRCVSNSSDTSSAGITEASRRLIPRTDLDFDPVLQLRKLQSVQKSRLRSGGLKSSKSQCDSLGKHHEDDSFVGKGSEARDWSLEQIQSQIELLEFVTRAVVWSIQAYKAVFTAFTIRSKPEHVLTDDPYLEFVTRTSVLGLSPHSGQCFMERAIKFCKESIAFLAAKGLGQDECGTVTDPILCSHDGHPMPGLLAGGWLGLRCRRIMHRVSKSKEKQIALSLDILMSKLGMAPAPEEFIRSSLEKHRKCLTTSRVDSEELFKGIPYALPEEDNPASALRQRIIRQIQRVCKRIFAGQRFHERDCFPSLNACFGSGRSEGGAFGDLFRGFVEHRHLSRLESQVRQSTNNLELLDHLGIEPNFAELVKMSYSVATNTVTEVRSIQMSSTTMFPSVEVLDEFQEYVDEACDEVLSGQVKNYAVPSPILEPLKVRIITKGNSAIYLRALELQKMMHGVLRKWAPFAAIGRPLSNDDFESRFPRELPEFFGYVSGDFSAATDNLDPEISRAIWEAICREVKIAPVLGSDSQFCEFVGKPIKSETSGDLMFTRWYEIGKLALTGHILKYPRLDGKDSDLEYPQVWGQLMGSPMSFPILCIANFVATCVGLDVDPVSYLEPCSPILVNGDDIAFICHQDKYSHWKEVVSSIGLTPSIGKNYFSRDFVIINSECRVPVLGTPIAVGGDKTRGELDTKMYLVPSVAWKLIPFVNLSLLWGYEKKGTEAGQSVLGKLNWWDLGYRCQQLMKGIEHGYDRIHHSFRNIHQEILDKVPSGISYYLPATLGGVGLPLPKGEKAENLVSEANLKFAAYLACLDNKQMRKILHRPQFEDSSIFVHLGNEIEAELAEACGGYRWLKNPATDFWWLQSRGLTNPLMMAYILGQLVSTNVLADAKEVSLRQIWSQQIWGKPGFESDFAKEKIYQGDILVDEGLCFSVARDLAENSVKHIEAAVQYKKQQYNWLLLKHYKKALTSSLEPMSLTSAMGYKFGYSLEAPWDSVRYPSSIRHGLTRVFSASDYTITKSDNSSLSRIFESWDQLRDTTSTKLNLSYLRGNGVLGLYGLEPLF
jgi:hypothetical protein